MSQMPIRSHALHLEARLLTLRPLSGTFGLANTTPNAKRKSRPLKHPKFQLGTRGYPLDPGQTSLVLGLILDNGLQGGDEGSERRSACKKQNGGTGAEHQSARGTPRGPKPWATQVRIHASPVWMKQKESTKKGMLT